MNRIWIFLVMVAVGAATVLLSVPMLRGTNLGFASARASSTPQPSRTAQAGSLATAPTVLKSWKTTGLQSGAMILLWGNDPTTLADSQALLDRLIKLNVNSVGLVFVIEQTGHRGTDLHRDPVLTPTDENISIVIREAHRRGFSVMLRPILYEGSLGGPQFWRGNIDPPVDAWFGSYDQILLSYAQLAETEHVEILDVGTEFASLEANTAQWLRLIGDTRGVFHGQLTYSADNNTDTPEVYPAFGRALDFLSLDAYYPLAAADSASVPQLVTAWGKWIHAMRTIHRNFDLPVVVTELGISPQSGVYRYPWLSLRNNPREPLNLELQRRYYEASCQALDGSVSGIYWWEFDMRPPANPLTAFTFDPTGKPAEQAIAACFGDQLQTPRGTQGK